MNIQSVNDRNIYKPPQTLHFILSKLTRSCYVMRKSAMSNSWTPEEIMSCVFSGTTRKKCTPVLIHFLNIFFSVCLKQTLFLNSDESNSLLVLLSYHHPSHGQQLQQKSVSTCLENPQLFLKPHQAKGSSQTWLLILEGACSRLKHPKIRT